MRPRASSFGDFKCAHCHVLVSSMHLISGVNNRNHCPYCLWSCHLDLYTAGDRLSACKAPMKPIGLTMKRGRNKYQREACGELMLIHQCTNCKALSINRIAADDDSETVMAIFRESLALEPKIHALYEDYGVVMLKLGDTKIVYAQLYGYQADLPRISWV